MRNRPPEIRLCHCFVICYSDFCIFLQTLPQEDAKFRLVVQGKVGTLGSSFSEATRELIKDYKQRCLHHYKITAKRRGPSLGRG